jgi:Immunity protein 61
VSTRSLRDAIEGWANTSNYGTLVDTDGHLQLYDKRSTEFIYAVSESEGRYAVSRSERRGPADPLAWNLSESTAAKYLVTELGTHMRYDYRLPNINRYHQAEDLPDGFTLARGEHGADSLYRDDELIGTFHGDSIAIPAVFHALVSLLPLAELEAAYLDPNGGPLSAMISAER